MEDAIWRRLRLLRNFQRSDLHRVAFWNFARPLPVLLRSRARSRMPKEETKMDGFRSPLLVAGAIAASAISTAASTDQYPSRPITFIVPWGAGGGADQVARLASRLIEPELKVSVPVVNMAGATGQTGLTKLVTGPADGYTIEVMTGDTFPLFAGARARFKLEQ